MRSCGKGQRGGYGESGFGLVAAEDGVLPAGGTSEPRRRRSGESNRGTRKVSRGEVRRTVPKDRIDGTCGKYEVASSSTDSSGDGTFASARMEASSEDELLAFVEEWVLDELLPLLMRERMPWMNAASSAGGRGKVRLGEDEDEVIRAALGLVCGIVRRRGVWRA